MFYDFDSLYIAKAEEEEDKEQWVLRLWTCLQLHLAMFALWGWLVHLWWFSLQPFCHKRTKGKPPTIVDRDDGIDKLDAAKLRKLRPVFKDVGFVTAGNSSSIRMGSDGAVGLVLASGAKARGLGLHVIAKLRGYADADQAPELFTMSPALAILKATASPGIEHSQVNF
ncbi:hypothetical protein CY35_14G104900 [Sphagnum magellanicum]|nr:hypothetical protein CY35_14G104900 [Sphagnum magellanicum]